MINRRGACRVTRRRFLYIPNDGRWCVLPFPLRSVLPFRLQGLEAVPPLDVVPNSAAARDFLNRGGSSDNGAFGQKQRSYADSYAHSLDEGHSAPSVNVTAERKTMPACCSIQGHGTLQISPKPPGRSSPQRVAAIAETHQPSVSLVLGRHAVSEEEWQRFCGSVSPMGFVPTPFTTDPSVSHVE